MANIYRNIAIHGLTELLSDPFMNRKTRSGKTILTDKLMLDHYGQDAETNETDQAALRKATSYANFARRQEVYVNRARGNDVNAYTIALIDWFGAPKVLEIDVDQWTGEIGQTIRVKARDNVRVVGVSVVIRDSDENVLEMGEAMQSAPGSPWWNYTTATRVPIDPFPMVEAIARDLAGNCDTFVIS